jgi:hypothetical protein
MNEAAFLYRALGCDQRLTDNLATEHALPTLLRAVATVEIVFDPFQIEDLQQPLHCSRHCFAFPNHCSGTIVQASAGPHSDWILHRDVRAAIV